MTDSELLELARKAASAAYAPYSQFEVGAAALLRDGRVVTGKTKDEFKLIFDSNEQGVAADAKPIDQTGQPIYMVVVVQVSGAMADALYTPRAGHPVRGSRMWPYRRPS